MSDSIANRVVRLGGLLTVAALSLVILAPAGCGNQSEGEQAPGADAGADGDGSLIIGDDSPRSQDGGGDGGDGSSVTQGDGSCAVTTCKDKGVTCGPLETCGTTLKCGTCNAVNKDSCDPKTHQCVT